jgi:plastocyanin
VKKYLALIGATIAAIVLGLALTYSQPSLESTQESPIEEQEIIPENMVSIVMLSSRPGCEKTGCYLPTTISVDSGKTITWVNEDRGLHTVTTGYYDTPDGMVESGQIAPEDKFSFTFDEPGQFHYYCRLHPWMKGTIIVN